MKITISSNPWCLPAPPLYLEGAPTPEERARQEVAAREARATWTPRPEAYALLERLRGAIGRNVVVQAWDPIMSWSDEEAPYPLRGRCVDVITRDDEEKLVRAYMVLEHVDVIKTPEGYDGRRYHLLEGDRLLFAVAEMYEVVVE